jgi:rubrerythrin
MSFFFKGDEATKEEVIQLLREQIKVEGGLIALYEKTAPDVTNKPVRHLLHMIRLDSQKHIDICQAAIDILRGEDVLQQEKQELVKGLNEHVKMEEDSIKRAEEIMKNEWIKQNAALSELIKKLRDDEKRHTEALKKLTKKTFFRLNSDDWNVLFRGIEFADERYERAKKYLKEE